MMNNAYADLVSKHPKRFKAFASIPMDNPDEALKELHRGIGELKLNGVILLDVNLDVVKEPKILEKHPGLLRAAGHLGLLGHNERTGQLNQ